MNPIVKLDLVVELVSIPPQVRLQEFRIPGQTAQVEDATLLGTELTLEHTAASELALRHAVRSYCVP